MLRRLLPLFLLVLFFVAVALPTAPAQNKDKDKKDDKDTPASLVFEMYKDKGGHYRFRIKNGETNLAGSTKGYDSKEECKKVIDTIVKNSEKAKIVEAKGEK
jgi:uncharacterized protein YegP (UPF0339 family)